MRMNGTTNLNGTNNQSPGGGRVNKSAAEGRNLGSSIRQARRAGKQISGIFAAGRTANENGLPEEPHAGRNRVAEGT
jgi:hypothetical protein